VFVGVTLVLMVLAAGWPERVVVYADRLDMNSGVKRREVWFHEVENVTVMAEGTLAFAELRMRASHNVKICILPGRPKQSLALVSAAFEAYRLAASSGGVART
jgi:hypothetical protein